MSTTALGWLFGGWRVGDRDERISRRTPTSVARDPVQAAHLTPSDAHRDADLLTAIRDGDEAAFERWYRETYPHLWQFAQSIVSSPDVASDVVQDVIASFWIRRTTIRIQTSVTAYLYGAVRQRALKEHRHDTVVRRTEQTALHTKEPLGTGTPSPSADRRLVAEEERAQLAHGVFALPERQREALLLWLKYGMNTAEVADILGVSDRAVRKLLEKAKGHLRDFLRRAYAAS